MSTIKKKWPLSRSVMCHTPQEAVSERVCEMCLCGMHVCDVYVWCVCVCAHEGCMCG